MAPLIELEEHEDSDEVHVGGVKLESNCCGADMIAAGHDSLHNKSRSHGIVTTLVGTLQDLLSLLLAQKPEVFLTLTS